MRPAFAALRALSIAAVALLLGAWAASPGLAQTESQRDRDEFYRDLARRTMPEAAAVAPRALAPSAPALSQETVLLVSGVIGPGAHMEFRAALSRGAPGLVVLDGPGGVLGEALLIAEEVRSRRLNTLVATNRRCASACAIVFLSGRTKYLGAGAAVGLHSASYADGRADPEATELMAAYLRQLGVPSGTLKRMAMTAPNQIRWLTTAEQKAIGIRAYR
ncbi:MAG: hypothetical protein ACRED5_15615 [Propylenella sp.]